MYLFIYNKFIFVYCVTVFVVNKYTVCDKFMQRIWIF